MYMYMYIHTHTYVYTYMTDICETTELQKSNHVNFTDEKTDYYRS